MTESSQEFVVYLRNVSNAKEFPNNNANNFTNIIRPNRKLISEYEVALKNIMFKQSYDAIVFDSNTHRIEIYIEFVSEGDRILNFTGIKYKPTRNIAGDSWFKAISNLDRDIKNFLIANQVIDENHSPIFRYDPFLNKVNFINLSPPASSKYVSYNVKWTFSESMGNFLGLDVTTNNSFNPIFNYPGKISGPEAIFVYCDIIETSSIGSQAVNILDIIPLPDIYAKNTVDMIYKRVNRTFIDKISIQLYDQFGERVAFTPDVIVTAILHFKPIH